jgi:hypothetical protein
MEPSGSLELVPSKLQFWLLQPPVADAVGSWFGNVGEP